MCNDEVCNYEEVINENVEAEKNPKQSGTIATPSTSKTSNSNARTSFSNFTNDPGIKRYTKFFNTFQQIMTDSNTLMLLIPYIS